MRLDALFIVIWSVTFGLVAPAVDVPLDRRQVADDATTTSASSTDGRSTEQPLSTTVAASLSASGGSVTTTASATSALDHSPASASNGTSIVPTHAAASATSLRAGDEPPPDPNVLPIRPKITPALGVAGIVLIILGGVYTLIGIKNKWIQVFLSAAFLTGLGVTVLIVYVMNSPVRDAVQGAYFVAVFATGVVFGALSLVFKDLTEGLGCLLGGFCLSMWLLALRPGGLVSGTGATAAFIGALSAGIYALSFSHHTRPYGLMGSTALSGATAVILGIDCFSRAGLKEFWLYIWKLNDDIFPLNTETYPVTRGIRVELAGTIIICLMGLISQLRLWKVIKDRREKQAELQKEQEKRRDDAEVEIGRKLEEGNMRDRAQWESIYGNRDVQQSDSGIGTEVPDSPRKQSTTVETTEIGPKNTFETENTNCQADHGNPDIEHEGEEQTNMDPTVSEICQAPQHVPDENVNELPGDLPPSDTSPPVVPLPFKVPEPEASTKDDYESVAATLAGSDRFSTRLSRRLSTRSVLRRLSVRSNAKVDSQSGEALVSPRSDDSPASSVAGVPDEDLELRSEVQTVTTDNEVGNEEAVPMECDVSNGQEERPEEKIEDDPAQGKSGSSSEIAETENSKVADQAGQEAKSMPNAADVLPARQVLSLSPVASPPPTTSGQSMLGKEDRPLSAHETPINDKEPLKTPSSKEKSAQGPARRVSLTTETVQQLPNQMSRVVTSYRTNEWAKHLSEAETPDLEPIRPVDDHPNNNTREREEVAVPVNMHELQQTALNARPPPAIESPVPMDEWSAPNNSRTLSDGSKRSQSKSPQPASPNPSGNKRAARRSSTRLSQISPASSSNLPRSGSASSLKTQQVGPLRGIRNTSNPFLNGSLAVAPIDESKEADFQEQQWTGASPLMAQRESIIRNRVSSTSLGRDSWLPRSNSKQSLGGSVPSPRPGSHSNLIDDDDMPLAHRRALIQQQQNPSRPEATMAAWRQSIREDLGQTPFPFSNTDLYRAGMLDHHQSRMGRQQQIMTANHIDNAVAQGMQRGDMRDLHREAIRRMQATAYRRGHGPRP